MLAESRPFVVSERTAPVEHYAVTSENFSDYLDSDVPLPARDIALSPLLVVPQYTADFEILDRYTKSGFVHSSDDRERLELSISATGNDSTLAEVRARAIAIKNQQGIIERGNTTYYDPETKQMEVSAITDGVHKMVVTDVFSLIRRGKDPRMAKHTHPTPSLPSPADLRLHLQEERPDGKPPVRASVTLCPGVQLMTLVTGETMSVMSKSEMQEFIQHWTDRDQAEQEIMRREMGGSVKAVFEQRRQQQEQQKIAGMAILNELVALSRERSLTEDERIYFDTEYARLKRIAHEPVDPRAVPEYAAAQEAYLNQLNSTTNRVLAEMLQTVRVAVYISHDMKHFEKVRAEDILD